MSGIALVANWDGGLREHAIRRVLSAMPQRGEAHDVWCDGVVAIGSTHDTTTRSSARNASSAGITSLAVSGNTVVAWTGQLHRRNLLPSLDIDTTQASPAAVLLALYERFGAQCATRVEGDFAFIIWNRDERRVLFARDRAGSRPLAYALLDGGLIVATDTQALRAHPGVRTRINQERIAEYLLDDMSSTTTSFFQGIERVAPANVMSAKDGRLTASVYWEPPRGVRGGSNASEASVRADVETFRALFDDAVAQRMPEHAAIGVLLSGGLDSSSVICTAAHLRAAAQCAAPIGVSAIYDTYAQCDERRYIREVHAAAQIEHRYVCVDDDSPLAHTAGILACHDEPPWMPNLFMLWRGTLPAARAAGVDVLLDGIDGDTVVAEGDGRIHDLLWSLQLRTLWGETHAHGVSARDAAARIIRLGVLPRVPLPVRRARRTARRIIHAARNAARNGANRRETTPGSASRDDGLVPVLIRRDFRRRTGVDERAANLEARFGSARDDADAHWFSVTAGVNSYALEILERSAAWHGISLHHPFYDHRLIAHCVGVASDRKVRNGETRWILREAMASRIPDAVRHRHSKADLSPCFNDGLRSKDGARIADALRRHRDRLAPFVDHAVLDAALQRFRTAPQAFDALAVWKAALLGDWIEHTELSQQEVQYVATSRAG